MNEIAPAGWYPCGETKVAAVIGDPVRHSISPAIHNAAFRACGLDWVFVAFEVPEIEVASALDGVRALGIAGLSVTMPHKAAVAKLVDRLTDEAAMLGAVNCVFRDGDQLVGDNTDGDGFIRSLMADTGFDPCGATCAVIGAGGAGRAVVAALARAGATLVSVINRSADRAAAASHLAGSVGSVSPPDELGKFDLVVNATPVGMGRGSELLPVGADFLHGGQVVVDLIYDPRETHFLRLARERGAVTANGLGMLVGQAAVSFERWTGVAAPIDVMTAAALGAKE